MGALAVHVARIARLRHPECAVPDEVRDCFAEMGTRSVELSPDGAEVMVSGDLTKRTPSRCVMTPSTPSIRHLFTMLIDHV